MIEGALSLCRQLLLVLLLALLVIVIGASAQQKTSDDQDKQVDIHSSVGDAHVGNDPNSRDLGLPIYPGGRLRKHDENRTGANFSILTQAFGLKFVVANYDSDDSPEKLIAYYRDKLKKYGKVLECHTTEHPGDLHMDAGDHDSNQSKELKCEGDNTGSVIELKVGAEDNQHVVAITPADSGKGSTFELIYIYARGKQADI